MNKLLLLIPLLLLVTPLAFASTQWVYSGDTFQKDGVLHSVEVGPDYTRVLLSVGGQLFILNREECRDNRQRQERYCLLGAGYEEAHITRVRYEHGRELFGYQLQITDIVPELKASRTISPNPTYNQASTITVTLTNEGDQTITGVRYTEQIPEGVLLETIDGQKEGNNYTYTRPSLSPDQTITFRYRITPIQHQQTSLAPITTYTFDNLQTTIKPDPFTINLPAPFTFSQALTKEQPRPGEDTTYITTITNQAQETITYTIKTTIPRAVTTKNQDALEQTSTLAKGEEKTHEMVFNTRETGDYPISTTLQVQAQGDSFTRYFQEQIKTRITALEPRIQTSRNTGVSGETITLRFYLENKDTIAFRSVQGIINATNLEETISLATIDRVGGERLVQEITHILPRVTERTQETIRFTGTYETPQRERFEFSRTATITVRPENDQYVITQKMSQSTYSPGDIIRVDVRVKNDEGSGLFLSAEDDLPFPITAGIKYADITLAHNEERQLYTYDFQIPHDHEGPILVTTAVTTRDSSRSYTTTLFPADEEITTGEQETQQVAASKETTTQSKKREGGFTRFWNFVKGFFG